MFDNSDLTVKIDSGNTIFSAGNQLTGNAHMKANGQESYDIAEVSVRLMCTVEVKIRKHDQNVRKHAQRVNEQAILLDREYKIHNVNEFFAQGGYDFPFKFDLPELPPSSSYMARRKTKGSIKHFVKVKVKFHNNSSFLTRDSISSKTYFTYIPPSTIPFNNELKEVSFFTDISSSRNGKFAQAMNSTSKGIDTFRRNVRIPILGLGIKALGGLSKLSAEAASKPSDALLLYGSMQIPSKGLAQGETTDFQLDLKTVNEEEHIMVKSVSIDIKTLQYLKFGQYFHERPVDTIPLFHKDLIANGSQISIPGTLDFKTATLPSFDTKLFAIAHKLQITIKFSRVVDGETMPLAEAVELLPVDVLSFVTRYSDSDACHIGDVDYRKFIVDPHSGGPAVDYMQMKNPVAQSNSHESFDDHESSESLPDYSYSQSDSDSSHDGVLIDQYGYPVDLKKLPEYEA